MHYTYQPHGVCSRRISLDINDGIVSNVEFIGGCHGNLQAIPRLVEGMSYERISALLSGINCGGKGTSCGDQLAQAVQYAFAESQHHD